MALESAGIKFPEQKTSGASLRSQKMKLPASVGQKKSKAIESLLLELNLETRPVPTEDISVQFNELRSDMVLLYELKMALANCEFELQTLKHQYEALQPNSAEKSAKNAAAGSSSATADVSPAVSQASSSGLLGKDAIMKAVEAVASGESAMDTSDATLLPPTLPSSSSTGSTGTDLSKKISEIIDVGSVGVTTPTRKRRAAVEQDKLLKKLVKE